MIRLAAAVLAAVLIATPAAADTHAAINAIYERIADGIRTHDPEMSRGAYAANAAYLPPTAGPIDEGERLHALMKASGERLKADGVDMTIGYRLTRRTVTEDTAIDMGYYRTAMKRSEGAEQVRYSKFLLVAARQTDGTWKITHDASLPSTREAYEAAAPVAGLKYDG